MAASFETTESFNSNREDLEASLFQALKDLKMNWEKDPVDRDRVTARVPLNPSSWGEGIEIRFVDDHTLRIKSRCVLPLQLFDSGKNKKNVQSIMAGIRARLMKQESSGSSVKKMSVEEALGVLCLARDATRAQIDSAYRDQVKKFHPDQVPAGLAEEFKKFAEEKMKLINEAYSLLSK